VSHSAITVNELGRLLHAWRVAQIEGPKDDPDALRFEYLLKAACFKGDAKFLGQLTRAFKKEIPRPWLPQTALEKVRLAYLSFDPEFHPTWDDVKALAIRLYPELQLIRPRHWQRLRAPAGLSWLPARGRGRPKKAKGKAPRQTS
jgi:hypothetical protein